MKVTTVRVTGSTATVTYTILIGGTPELPHETGQAILSDGRWMVSTQTFCGLLALEGGAPAICTAH